MNRFRRRYRRTTAGSLDGPARYRPIDVNYGLSLVETGNAFRADTSAPNVRVLTFHGELDVSKKEWIESALAAIERFSPETVAILDLTDVQYLDTTFLNALLRAERRKQNDALDRPRIVAPRRGMPSRILSITKLDSQFGVFEDLASAER